MAKRALYSRDEILDATVQAVHERGHSATVADVTAVLKAPSGSIYHRFPSRHSLFVSAWMRCVRQFHSTFAHLVTGDPVDAIVATGLQIPRFCREHPAEARTLTLFRYSVLMADPPADLAAELEGLNDPVADHIAALTRRRYGRVTQRGRELVALACRDTPYGMVRSLIGGPIPEWLDEPIAAASRAIALLDDKAG
ncbi:TetR family transcriptional regulator [Kribbella sp. VKM Ac-2571]|uniref:TetR/AcrR family transcriptional regulator n=1 Tax=Kribbella sp. VKM Ac-2571 TaxID=2512222 RepID=UPI00105E391D|nr:TetR/AcrR family transcriptional regulator [Kribbella sp. VKM Ac-2571]TDO66630.1 TetR family transcriptional regulator [Kribbella sp. VKM Ac-2571]